MNRVCAIHQPNFFPWPGYFDKIQKSDVFVFLDDVKYTKASWTNRVRIDIEGMPAWATCHVSASSKSAISEVEIVDTRRWREKLLKTISANYANFPNFKKYFPIIEELITHRETNLAQFNMNCIRTLCRIMAIDATFLLKSDLQISTNSNQMLIDICKKVGANTYLCGNGADGYQIDSMFEENGISVRYQKFEQIPYGPEGRFIAGLSIIDLLLKDHERPVAGLISRDANASV